MKKRKKQAMTLLEVMIVIFIIGIISSVIGYNMKGSLNKAKAFKTTEGMKKILEIFELEIAQGSASLQEVVSSPESVLEGSGLVTSGKEMFKDGWGQPYEIKLSSSGKILLKSKAYETFLKKQKKKIAVDTLALDDDQED
jgi:prepilin-type N-terminal cleavage/methylation domain-containing protein